MVIAKATTVLCSTLVSFLLWFILSLPPLPFTSRLAFLAAVLAACALDCVRLFAIVRVTEIVVACVVCLVDALVSHHG